MGRHAKAWVLLWRGKAGSKIAYVRFRHEGARYDLTTRKRDPGAAAKEAARIYGDVVSGKWAREQLATAGGSKLPLNELTAKWIEDFEKAHPTGTPDIYDGYAARWESEIGPTLGHLTDEANCERFMLSRLTAVVKETVKKEMSAIRTFLRWCVLNNYLSEKTMPRVPSPPKHSTGVRATKRKEQATPMDHVQARAFCDALPLLSTRSVRGETEKPFPVRARFIVMWETGLRPATLDKISAPRHYSRGLTHLHITADIDKARYDREVKLSTRAREALDSVCPDEGLIFGKHDYRKIIAAAKTKAGSPKTFSPYDLRHGRATDLLARGASLSGVGFVLGHKQATTTNRYLRMSQREGDKAIELEESATPTPSPADKSVSGENLGEGQKGATEK